MSPILWAGLIICCIEITFEYRAAKRGFSSLLFSPLDMEVIADETISPITQYGPSNDFPFRSKIIAKEKREGERRIWISSSSHAADKKMPAGKLFPNLMGSELGDWSVINASEGGLSISDNNQQLNELGLVWNPDVVVLYQASNELTRIARFGRDPNVSSADLGNESKSPTDFPASYVSHLCEQLTLYSLLKTNLTARLSKARLLKDDLLIVHDDQFTRHLDQFVSSVNAIEAIPVICTFATSHGVEALERLPADYELGMLRITPSLSKFGWANTIARWNDLIRDYGVKHGVIVLDVSREFTGETSCFRDFVHFSPEGHSRMAAYLSDQIFRLLEVSEEGK